ARPGDVGAAGVREVARGEADAAGAVRGADARAGLRRGRRGPRAGHRGHAPRAARSGAPAARQGDARGPARQGGDHALPGPRAARSEAHSGPAARLDDAERPEPEREDEQEAPAAVYACEHQDGERDAARHEGARTEQQPALAARGHEVRGAGGHRAHLSTWGTPTWPPNPPNARGAAGNPWRSSMTRAWPICTAGRRAGAHRGWPASGPSPITAPGGAAWGRG